jgi:hypothetical protein
VLLASTQFLVVLNTSIVNVALAPIGVQWQDLDERFPASCPPSRRR